MVLSIFFLVGFDVAMNTNIANYLRVTHLVNLETASLGISIYFAALMAGRFLGGTILLTIWKPLTFLIISTILTLVGLSLLLVIPGLNGAYVLIFITGFGFSNIFPLIFALTVEKKPEYANEISGLIILAVSGGAVIPPITGILTDRFGVTASIYVLIVCILYTAFTTYYLVKSGKNNQKQPS